MKKNLLKEIALVLASFWVKFLIACRATNSFLKKFSPTNIFNINWSTGGFDFDEYIKALEAGEFKNKFFLGIGKNGMHTEDPLEKPGALIIGGTGGGKSVMGSGLCTTLLCSSGESTFMGFADFSKKGMGDYRELYSLEKNSCKALFDIEKIIPFVNVFFNALEERSIAFKNMDGSKAVDIYDANFRKYMKKYNEIIDKLINNGAIDETSKELIYRIHSQNLLQLKDEQYSSLQKVRSALENKTMPSKSDLEVARYSQEFTGCTRMYMVFEEFHNVPYSEEVDFDDNKFTRGTVAYKMKEIARTGRAMGICIVAMTQRASHKEFPLDLMDGVTNIHAHRIETDSAASMVNLEKAAMITVKGRSLTKEGFYQFPYMSPQTRQALVTKYAKPLVPHLIGGNVEKIRASLEGDGVDGVIDTYPMSEVVTSYQVLIKSIDRIVSRLLTSFGFEYEPNTNKSLNIKGFASKDGVKFGVYYDDFRKRYQGRGQDDLSDKKLKMIGTDLKIKGINRMIGIAFGHDHSLESYCRENRGIYMDWDEILEAAKIIDDRGSYDENQLEAKLANIPIARKILTDEELENLEEGDTEDEFIPRQIHKQRRR